MRPFYMLNIRFLGLLVLLSSCAKMHERSQMSVAQAKKELETALIDTTIHNIIKLKTLLIPDEKTAVGVVEPVLFKRYGKENIIFQRPYQSYLINDYWIISGTLPKEYDGGTFLVILNAKNAEIIRLTHGK